MRRRALTRDDFDPPLLGWMDFYADAKRALALLAKKSRHRESVDLRGREESLARLLVGLHEKYMAAADDWSLRYVDRPRATTAPVRYDYGNHANVGCHDIVGWREWLERPHANPGAARDDKTLPVGLLRSIVFKALAEWWTRETGRAWRRPVIRPETGDHAPADDDLDDEDAYCATPEARLLLDVAIIMDSRHTYRHVRAQVDKLKQDNKSARAKRRRRERQQARRVGLSD